MTHEFHTLFLPLAEDERAVFASVLSTPFAARVTRQRGMLVGEHTSREPLRTVSCTASSPSNIFSPAEAGGHCEAANDSACGSRTPSLSMLFAVGSARADAVIAVLRTGDILLYGLDRTHMPPYKICRIRPLPTTQQLLATHEKTRQKMVAGDGATSDRRRQHVSGSEHTSFTDSIRGDAAEATCAALLPLHISYCCRISLSAPVHMPTAAIGEASPISARWENAEDVVYLRGIVGSSDGRVSLFTTTAYTLSFAAHEVPIAQVDAVLLPPCTLDGDVSKKMSFTATTTACCVHGAEKIPNLALTDDGETTSGAWPRNRDRLAFAMQRLGLVTSGNDGVVLLWRRLGGTMSPIVVVRPSFFANYVAYTVHHPSALPTMLSVRTPVSEREAAIDAELSCPPSFLLHATTSLSHTLRLRQLASLSPRPLHTFPASVSNCERLEAAAPTSMTTTFRGSWSSTITALATDNAVTLVAMGVSLLSLLHLDGRNATRVWKAEDIITHLVLRDSVALAVCARSGAVHVLTIHPRTGQAEHRKTYYSYKNRSIRHISLHAASLLMIIVDVCGSTELVQLPTDVLFPSQVQPLDGDYMGGDPSDVSLLASMAALRAKVCTEDIKNGCCTGVSAAKGLAFENHLFSMYDANVACDQLNERLLLARYAVPGECDKFLAANVHVL